MSKMDSLRAMREARHAEATARAGKPKAPLRLVEPATDSKKAPADKALASRPEAVPELAEVPGPQLCGHRAISGKSCTREHGHSAKSHRYS